MASIRHALNATSPMVLFNDSDQETDWDSITNLSSGVEQDTDEEKNSALSSRGTTAGVQPKNAVRPQYTDITVRLEAIASRQEAIESRLHALEAPGPHRQEAASSPSITLDPTNHTSNASLSTNASWHGVTGSASSDFNIGSSHLHGKQNLDFDFGSNGHNDVGNITAQQQAEDDVFDDMFDFDGASYAADANDQSGTFDAVDLHGFGTMGVSTPSDTAMLPPATVTASSYAMSVTPSAAVGPVAPPRPRFQCPNCGKMFFRPGDRDRHALKHNPNAQRYPCIFPGCRYSGMRAFLRKDKLREHRARHGH